MRQVIGVASALFAAVFISAAVAAASPAERLTIRMVPHFDSAPGDLRITVSVEPDDRNRRLRVEVDSAEQYQSSEVPLEGERAARTHSFTFNRLPAGTYEIRAIAGGPESSVTAVERFVVFASDVD